MPQIQHEDEIEIGRLFIMIGNAFQSFFKFIGNGLNKIFLSFIWLVLFIKKNIIVFAVAAIIGFVIGFAQSKIASPTYRSETIIKQNYDTGETLNDLISYLNNLISANDTINLASNLGIDVSDSGKLVEFEMGSLVTGNQQIRSFYFYKRELDSMTSRSIDLETYIENTKDYNYDVQLIKIRTSDQVPYGTIINEIIERVATSNYFKNQQKKDLNELNRREQLILESLKESDSLQKIYQGVLEKSVEPTAGSQTSVTIDNNKDKGFTKEFELYNQDLELRRELVRIEREKEDKEFIIEILSESNKVGVKESVITIGELVLNRNIAYAIILTLIVFLVLLFKQFLEFLESYSNRIK